VSKPVWLSSLGDFNSMPKPYKEIDCKEFLDSLSRKDLVREERRQVKDLVDGELVEVKIFWFEDCALALIKDKEKFIYFRIGCGHKHIEEKKIRSNYFEVRCLDCGYKFCYDSSD
jgi:hypothetical protein